MPIIINRTTLYDAVTGYLGRGDMTSYYDLWVQQAETFLRRKLRTGEVRGTITLSTANTNSLPAFAASVRAVRISSPVGEFPLTLVTATMLEELRAMYVGNGMPRYAHVDAALMSLAVVPTPDASYTATLVYVENVSPLGPLTSDSSVALTTHPDLYLYAVLREACEFLEDPRVEKFGARVDEILHWIRVQQQEVEASGAPMPARLPTSF